MLCSKARLYRMLCSCISSLFDDLFVYKDFSNSLVFCFYHTVGLALLCCWWVHIYVCCLVYVGHRLISDCLFCCTCSVPWNNFLCPYPSVLCTFVYMCGMISYTPLLSHLSSELCCSSMYCDMVFVDLNAMCICVPLNILVIFLILGLTYVEVTHSFFYLRYFCSFELRGYVSIQCWWLFVWMC
jgi:hypothetical protein